MLTTFSKTLRALESYLKIKDQGRVLGNLNRVATPEGHVKWVCFDHYKVNYQESAIQQLREIVEENGGRFMEEKGRVEFKISSNVLAREFYNTMIEARKIQELDITLEWDATTDDDLQVLSNVITTSFLRKSSFSWRQDLEWTVLLLLLLVEWLY
ncbi:hypothetical protein BGZ65_004127 [Modicella reniformis]|uniref:Uncharacterized protein n=1 Tax=Modicella reniformis TaxID=1440133 RepID=A0A9P6STJ1_9FUNG|nr:hypothetical protein BGZ65_004127 [Modicella reniformis]